MNTEQAFKLGVAYRLGMLYANFLTCDSNTNNPYWVTIKNGKHLLINSYGDIQSGHFKGSNIADLSTSHEKKRAKNNYNPSLDLKSLYKQKLNVISKHQEAVNDMLKAKHGYIPNAFHNKHIGDIDLHWGDENSGLHHILERRSNQKGKIKEMLAQLDEIVTKGQVVEETVHQCMLRYNNFTVIISKGIYGTKRKAIITAFPQKKLSKP